MFQPLVGFTAVLTARLLASEAVLPLSASNTQALAEALSLPNDTTRLWLDDGLVHEIVQVTGIVQGNVLIARGQEGTQPRTLPCGTCVRFEWTPQNLADFIQQGLGGYQSAVCEVIAASSRVQVSTTDCVANIDVPPCIGAPSWRSGNLQYTQDEAGCIATTPVSTPLVDGQYLNATVTVREGNLVAIQSGTNIVYSGGCGCCCKDTPAP